MRLFGLLLLLMLGAKFRAAAEPGLSFQTFDLLIEGAPAAWQVELVYPAAAKIVGLEGGEPPFAEPPTYDRRGLEGGRILIAAYTLEEGRFSAKTLRVARMHFAVPENEELSAMVLLLAAARPGGRRYEPKIFLRESEPESDSEVIPEHSPKKEVGP